MALTRAQLDDLITELKADHSAKRARVNAIGPEIDRLQSEQRALTASLDEGGGLVRAIEALRDARGS